MFQKPNAKSVTNAATTVGAFVVGAKVGDGLIAVMPESTSKYKKIALGAVAIILAASVNASTTKGKVAQNALLGMGAKQLSDELTDNLMTAIPQKGKADAVTGVITASNPMEKFTNAIVGHLNAPSMDFYDSGVGAAWDGGYADDVWERPRLEEMNPVSGL